METCKWKRLYPLFHQASVSNCIWQALKLRNILRNKCECSLEILVTLPLVRWAPPPKGNITSELWPKFFQDTTHLHCEKLFAAALKCLGPPFSDTICHAEPLFLHPLLGTESNSKQRFYSVTAMCHVTEKQRPREELEDSGFSAIIHSFRWQWSVSALAGVFVKAPGRTPSDKEGDLWAASGFPEMSFPKVKACRNLFYTGHQVISLEMIKSLSQNNYYLCFIYMNTAIMITAKNAYDVYERNQTNVINEDGQSRSVQS